MPAPAELKVTLEGLKDYHRGLRSLKDPEFTRMVKPIMRDGMKKAIVPRMKSDAPEGRGNFRQVPGGVGSRRSATRGKRGTKGPLKKSISAKYIKARSLRKHRSSFGSTAQPRAWYGHFVTGGTKPHGLLLGADRKSGKDQKESKKPSPWGINRWHPGSAANAFVDSAAKAGTPAAVRYVERSVLLQYKRRAKAK